MNRDRRLITRGVGIGIVLTTTLFFLVTIFSVPKKDEFEWTDAMIVERARSLGMIYVSELPAEKPEDVDEILEDQLIIEEE